MPLRMSCIAVLTAILAAVAAVAAGCTPAGNGNQNGNGNDNSGETTWGMALESGAAAPLRGIDGTSGSDLLAVGGNDAAEVLAFDGDVWTRMVTPDGEPLNDVVKDGEDPTRAYAVGNGGTVLALADGSWTALDPGTTDDLHGIAQAGPGEFWIVGGSVGADQPVIIMFDGTTFTAAEVPANDRAATALFAIAALDDTIFAVGENGLIVQRDGDVWMQVSGGTEATDDFRDVALTAPDEGIAVGGASRAQIASWDGSAWTTIGLDDTAPLHGAGFFEGRPFVVGVDGLAGVYDPDGPEVIAEATGTTGTLADVLPTSSDELFAVGSLDDAAVALRRARGASGAEVPSIVDACNGDDDCGAARRCDAGTCIDRTACTSGDECAEDEVCEGGFCVDAPECVEDADCADQEFCFMGNCLPLETAPCTGESDCDFGRNCIEMACLPVEADVQYLVTVDEVSTPVTDGQEIPVFRGFQGGVHIFVTFRTLGFAPAASVRFSVEALHADTEEVLASLRTFTVVTQDIGDGVNEAVDLFVTIDRASPGELVDVPAVITITVEAVDDDSVSATITQQIVLDEMVE